MNENAVPAVLKYAGFYTINHLVYFHTRERTLSNSVTDEIVTLQNPASLILLCLIMNNGNVVSQNELIAAGWGEKNSVTSANTFYQTILILRNALEYIGLPRDLIKTIARRGLMISADIQAHEIAATPAAATVVTPPVEAPVVEPIVEPVVEPIIVAQKRVKILSFRFPLSVLFLSLSLLVAIIGGVMGTFFLHQKSLLSSYDLLATDKLSSCTVLQNGNDALKNQYLRFIRKHHELCRENNYIFLSGVNSAKNIAAVICPQDVRKKTSTKCTTYYSINNEN
ncbi:winged helix-turn-helix domain-containing protein [Citrobacter sp. Awk 4]|uniref:winged helix-turn-helix domain-containing protein n=1 Tax=Citrobacter sp. Awk 4 TaxID=2963955 RepID=UPI002301FF9D|nr:winged helix-turn-helix domain-containing protein [Citrobacter sp. Awk 4]MDA8481174.1 winged helix-turn-helix domain-containing protein [Citrobacter sp. Awk 4]